MSDAWNNLNFKPDLTDRQLPVSKIVTNRLQVVSVTVSLPLSSVPIFVRDLRIKTEAPNKGTIYIGAGVSVDLRNNGYPLLAGDELNLPINDLSVVYFQGDTLNDAIRIIYGS